MKITKTQLKRIIKEEIKVLLVEVESDLVALTWEKSADAFRRFPSLLSSYYHIAKGTSVEPGLEQEVPKDLVLRTLRAVAAGLNPGEDISKFGVDGLVRAIESKL